MTLGLTLSAVVAIGQTPEVQAELQKQLEALRKAQKGPPTKHDPKLPGKVISPTPLPESIIGRLGESRLRHVAKPLCITFSPDSKRVISGGEDGMLRVWDIASGEALNSLHSPDGVVRQVRFTHGGSLLAVRFNENRIHFLNPETLKETGQFEGEFGSDFATSPDGKLIAHFVANGMMRVTEIENNLAKLEVPAGSPFQFHPDNKHLAVANGKGVITLFLLAGGKPVQTIDNGGQVRNFVFSPDGKRLVCSLGDVARVWDISGAKTAKPLAEIKDAGRVGSWLDNNRLTANGTEGAGVYDLDANKWLGRVRGITGEWTISPDGTKVASTGTTGLRVHIWELATGNQLHADNDAFPEPALLAPTADGKHVFLIAGENVFLWPIDKPRATTTGKLPGKALVAAVGKDRLVVATPEAVHVYDDFDPLKPLATKPSRKLVELAKGCRAIAVSPDGKKVAYSGEENRIQIADAASGKLLRTLPIVTAGIALAFSPDGEQLAVVGRDGFLRLTPVKEGVHADLWKVRIQRGQRGTVAFSPDGKLIAASSSGMLKVANANDGSEVFTTGGIFDNGLFEHLQFSPDGRLLLAASEGMTGGVRVWELATQSLVKRFTTGFGTVSRIGLFPDGTRFVSAGAEETITAWDLTGRHGKESPKTEELASAWRDLESSDAAIGYPASRVLAAGQTDGVKTIAAGLEETVEARKRIAQWVLALGSDDPVKRDRATTELLAAGTRALPALREAAAKSEKAEIGKRAEAVLGSLTTKGVAMPTQGLAGDDLRLLRAAQVLGDIGTPEVIPVLRRLEALGGPASGAATLGLKRLTKQ